MPYKDIEKRRAHDRSLEVKARRRACDKRVKLEVFTHYSKGKLDCACCGESHIEFLTIDHIEGGGRAHRKSLKMRAGIDFYYWLKKNGYPSGYRVLCYNCNCSRGHSGYCPHEKERSGSRLVTVSFDEKIASPIVEDSDHNEEASLALNDLF